MPEDAGTPSPTKRERQRERADQQRVAAEQQKRSAQRRSAMWTIAVVVAVVVVGTALVVTRAGTPPAASDGAQATPDAIAGVETYTVTDPSHVEGPVTYEQTPPVGGPHAPAWQNCGVYDAPVANENAVHSMEHGAVWIAYSPALPDAEVDAVRSLAAGNPYVLVSPHPDVTTGVVASAWSKQLALDSLDEAKLSEFVTAFAQGPQSPEPGAPCTGGIGEPSG